MILRRITAHIREQDWTAVAIDFVIVVVGIVAGLQVNLWNEARVDEVRRRQIIDALVTMLNDAITVQERFVAEIDAGMADWESAYERGETPPPFFYRIDGSDVAPDVWSTFAQMQLTELFDAVTLFDLMFFHSELNGVGQKYLRYVRVVEDDILPGLLRGKSEFYDADGRLRPVYRANMDRLLEYEHEVQRLTAWAGCLVYRLRADRTFDRTCGRTNYRLEGMDGQPQQSKAELRS